MIALLLAASLAQTPLVFKSDGGSIALDAKARCVSLDSAAGANFHDGALVPIATAVTAGTRRNATSLQPQGDGYAVRFGDGGPTLLLKIAAHREGIEFRVLEVLGPKPDEVRFAQISTRGMTRRGSILNCRWNGSTSVALLALDESVEAAPWSGHGLGATAHSEFGMAGKAALLVITTPSTMLASVRAAERAFGLPSPTIGGVPTKLSPETRGNYLFTDLTPANADETIRLAKLGGFKNILVYVSTWSQTAGTYAINTRHYPGGEAELRTVIDKCHRAGLGVGMHLVSSMIGKGDPLVRPTPDPRLLLDSHATLASPIGPGDATMSLSGALADFPTDGAFYGNVKGGRDVRIGDEIVQYQSIDVAGNRLLGCTRGFAGTQAVAHPAGAHVGHLAERYGSYLANLRTNLLPQLANRISGLINRCGFDMVYFDGGENASANGPYWYWVGRLQSEVMKWVRRDLVVQGSGITHWSWHWFTRGTSDDYAALAPAAYLDLHKIADSYKAYSDDFLPAELGWWALLARTPQWRGTTPADVDAYGARMVALNAGVSLETTYADLRANARTEEILRRLALWTAARDATSKPGRTPLLRGTWTLDKAGQPTAIDVRLAIVRGGSPWTVDPAPGALVSVRIEALPDLGTPDATLVTPKHLPVPSQSAPMPGWSAARFQLAPDKNGPTPFLINSPQTGSGQGVDLRKRRPLAVTLEATGGPGQDLGVLNIQLESPGKVYRDAFVDVRPGLATQIVEPNSGGERMLAEFRPPSPNYAYKAAVYAFDYQRVVAVNIRWARAPAPGVSVRLVSVKPVPEASAVVGRPTLTVGGQRVVLPQGLSTGESLEIDASGNARAFDIDGKTTSTYRVALPKGSPSPASVSVDARARITLGFSRSKQSFMR